MSFKTKQKINNVYLNTKNVKTFSSVNCKQLDQDRRRTENEKKCQNGSEFTVKCHHFVTARVQHDKILHYCFVANNIGWCEHFEIQSLNAFSFVGGVGEGAAQLEMKQHNTLLWFSTSLLLTQTKKIKKTKTQPKDNMLKETKKQFRETFFTHHISQ